MPTGVVASFSATVDAVPAIGSALDWIREKMRWPFAFPTLVHRITPPAKLLWPYFQGKKGNTNFYFRVFQEKWMMKAQETGDLDHFDMRIMEALSEDGRMSVLELSRRVGLSKTPCQTRLKRLVDEGYILGVPGVAQMQRSLASSTSLSPRSSFPIRERRRWMSSMQRCARSRRWRSAT